MIVKFPVPYITANNNIYLEAETKRPSGLLLADVNEAMQKTNEYNSMRVFASGCCERIIGDPDITDKVSIKGAIAKMSNKTVEHICAQVMIDYYDNDDYVEGLYICPRCGNKVLAEKKDDDGIIIDTRDRISDLRVGFMEDISDLEFDVDLGQTIDLESKTLQESVSNITLRFPIMEDYIKACNAIGIENPVRIQYYVYGQCIIKVDGTTVDDTWRRAYGAVIFNKLENTKEVFKQISNHINKYGIDPDVEKRCNNCGKVWKVQINSTNFFASALQ